MRSTLHAVAPVYSLKARTDGDAEGSDQKTAARRQAAAETQTQVLADQVHDRPLQKKQEALHAVAVADKKEKDARSTTPPPEEAPPSPSGRTTVPLPETSESDDETVIMEEAVLKDDDRELDRVLEVGGRFDLC